MPQSLLFIEDNEDILLNLFAWFEARNFICDCARNGKAGLELATRGQFDCVILDILLPGLDGVQVCRKLKEGGLRTPVIMLTAKDNVEDIVAGLESGADDYLVKPFSLKELEARIGAVLRRAGQTGPELRFGGLILDRGLRRATLGNLSLHIAPTGFRILEALLAAAPSPVPKEKLEALIWGDSPPEGSALRNHIHELRKLLSGPFSRIIIETIPRLGWRLKEK